MSIKVFGSLYILSDVLFHLGIHSFEIDEKGSTYTLEVKTFRLVLPISTAWYYLAIVCLTKKTVKPNNNIKLQYKTGFRPYFTYNRVSLLTQLTVCDYFVFVFVFGFVIRIKNDL